MTFFKLLFKLIQLLRSETGSTSTKLRSVVVVVIFVVTTRLRVSVLLQQTNNTGLDYTVSNVEKYRFRIDRFRD